MEGVDNRAKPISQLSAAAMRHDDALSSLVFRIPGPVSIRRTPHSFTPCIATGHPILNRACRRTT